MNSVADRNRSELEKARPSEGEEGGAIRSPQSVQADSGGGAQLLHIELGLGKSAAIILWVSCLISAIALVGLWANYSALRTVSAQYQVLQYDHQALKAQLVAQGIYEGTEH